jgi:hypothetical protein
VPLRVLILHRMFSENLLLPELYVSNAIDSSNETRRSIDVSGRELGLPSHDSGFQ